MSEKDILNDAYIVASFHGETWYECPHCSKKFEFYDAKRKEENGEWWHICPFCGKAVNL